MPAAMDQRELAVCSRCKGLGYEGHKVCAQCRGIGCAAAYGDLFLFWGKRIDGFTILLGKVKAVIDAVVDTALILSFLGGGVLLWRRVSEVEPRTVLGPFFWQDPHPSLLAFWAGLIALMLWYYRYVTAREQRQFVRAKTYGDLEDRLDLPADPATWEFARKLPRKRRIDVARSYTKQSQRALDDAYALAHKLKSADLEPVHVFATLLSTTKIAVLFTRLGVQFEKFRDGLMGALGETARDQLGTGVSPALRKALLDAYVEAYEEKQPQVDVTELFMAVLKADAKLQELLFDVGIDVQRAENVVQWIRVNEKLQQRHRRFSAAARTKPKDAMNRSMTAVATPFLDRISTDLTRYAAFGYLAPVVGRDQEFEAIFRVIEGGGKSVVLVGQPGVGKSSMIEGIAQRMVEEDVPKILQDKRLISLDIAQLVSGADAATAQERLLHALYEIGRAGNIVLVAPNVAGMVGISAGSGESIDLSRVFAGELAKGYFFAITTATPGEYVSALEGSPLGRALTKVEIPEPDVNDAIQVLEARVGGIEYKNDVFYSYEAIEAAVLLSDRYMHEEYLPEKAIQVAKEAAQAARKAKGKGAAVTREDVASVIGEKTHVPVTQITSEEKEKLLNLEARMHKRMVGQDEAVSSVSAALRRARAELREESRPIANFLFLGPTGVGKTELAKTLAAEYFGSEGAMIRLDMSEYQDKASIYKLIGEPAGATAGGILTEAIRKRPFSLLLLDELEKSHPDILTVFLQVMDDGRLTDNTGRTIDFTNVILIATSNAGSQFIQDQLRQGANIEVIKEGLMTQELKGIFRPEFLNRFDGIVVFRPLTQKEIVKIAELMLIKVGNRLEEKGILFEATEEAIKEIADAGFDPVFGARPLRRVIQDRVDNAIADVLLKGEVGRRDKVILEGGGKLRVEKAKRL